MPGARKAAADIEMLSARLRLMDSPAAITRRTRSIPTTQDQKVTHKRSFRETSTKPRRKVSPSGSGQIRCFFTQKDAVNGDARRFLLRVDGSMPVEPLTARSSRGRCEAVPTSTDFHRRQYSRRQQYGSTCQGAPASAGPRGAGKHTRQPRDGSATCINEVAKSRDNIDRDAYERGKSHSEEAGREHGGETASDALGSRPDVLRTSKANAMCMDSSLNTRWCRGEPLRRPRESRKYTIGNRAVADSPRAARSRSGEQERPPVSGRVQPGNKGDRVDHT